MEIFNIGPMELILIVLLAILLVGPREMIQLTRRAGELTRQASQSRLWREISGFERQIRKLPVQLMREAGIEEIEKEMRAELKEHGTISLNLYPESATAPLNSGETRSSAKLRPPMHRNDRPPSAIQEQPAAVEALPPTHRTDLPTTKPVTTVPAEASQKEESAPKTFVEDSPSGTSS